jgi:hypothetical protein
MRPPAPPVTPHRTQENLVSDPIDPARADTADWEHYAPDRPAADDAQPFGDKTPDDLRTDDGETHEVHVSHDDAAGTDSADPTHTS